MKITVFAKPNAREERVEKTGENEFVVSVKEPPVEGRANRAVCAALAAHFGVSASHVQVRSGYASRRKVVEIASPGIQ